MAVPDAPGPAQNVLGRAPHHSRRGRKGRGRASNHFAPSKNGLGRSSKDESRAAVHGGNSRTVARHQPGNLGQAQEGGGAAPKSGRLGFASGAIYQARDSKGVTHWTPLHPQVVGCRLTLKRSPRGGTRPTRERSRSVGPVPSSGAAKHRPLRDALQVGPGRSFRLRGLPEVR